VRFAVPAKSPDAELPVLSELNEAAADVAKAQETFMEAEKAESFARSRSTSARNDLNNAQKRFDALVAKFKEAAPIASDWNADRRRKFEVAA
jgi:hypothetical protein